MAFDFAAAKTLVRQTVHDTLAVQAFFKDSLTNTSTEITARWHTRLVSQGGVDGVGATVMEGVDQVVFDRAQLADLGLAPKRGDSVTFPKYELPELFLDVRKPYDGPVDEAWLVTRE